VGFLKTNKNGNYSVFIKDKNGYKYIGVVSAEHLWNNNKTYIRRYFEEVKGVQPL